MKIKLLPDSVINQISAGEVIERPASVVRELVDNAVDAGAKNISVYIEAGGKSLIKVSDDGAGMSREDALMAFERHATSKLSSPDDLLSINTFGFRGEALPSIAAVSKVYLRTKSNEDELATELLIEAGKIKSVKQVAGNKGSEFQVSNLFYNTPARRNFLKTNKTEEIKIKQWLINFCLVHPEIRFQLYIDNKEVLNLPRRSSISERAQSFLKGSIVDVRYTNPDYQITGMVAHPSMAQSDSSSFMLYINKRYITDRIILRAVKEGFDSMLKDREYPLGFLSINMPPELVDVNVHPQKSEVRFRKPQDVFLAVRSAVLSSIKGFKAPLSASSISEKSFNLANSSYEIKQNLAYKQDFSYLTVNEPAQYAQPNFFFETHETTPLNEIKYRDLNFIGQIFDCYLLCTLQNSFYVVDMHAAHERCNFNIIRRQFCVSSVQSLAVPLIIELTEEGCNSCLEYSPVLSEYGFQIEEFSEKSIALRAIPASINQNNATFLIEEVSKAELPEAAEGKVREKLDHIVARIACHASIRSGYKMKREEVYALFDEMDRAESAASCPHGRPVAVKFTENDIEKWFGRDR